MMSHDAGMIRLEVYHFILASTGVPRARNLLAAEGVENVVPHLQCLGQR